jgi:hypothetical protein
MAATYELIASTTLPTATNSYTFSSIPSTFNDLVLVCNWKGNSVAANLYLRLNGDTGANYPFVAMGSYGSTSTTYGYVGTGSTWVSTITTTGSSANDIWCGTTIDLNEYSNTSVWKNVLSKNSSSNEVTYGCTNWTSTAAINSIQVFSNGPDYAVGSMFTLYGIKAA